MKTKMKVILHAILQTATTLKQIASLTLNLPALAMILAISLPATLSAQARLNLVPPNPTVLANVSPTVQGLAVDPAGNLFYSDLNSSVIQEISATGVQAAFVDLPCPPYAIGVDQADNIYATLFCGSPSVSRITPQGVTTNLGGVLSSPTWLAVDTAGEHVLVSDPGANRLVSIDVNNRHYNYVEGVTYPGGVAISGVGNAYYTQVTSNAVFENGVGRLPIVAYNPEGVAVDAAGNVFVMDMDNSRVVELPAGSNQQFTVASGVWGEGIAVDVEGNLFMTDTSGHLLKAATTSVNFGTVSTCPTCSARLTLNYGVTASGTLGQVKVLTQGLTNLDFTLTRNTCTGSVTAGSTCSIDVKFSPKAAGLRSGIVQIMRADGTVAASTNLYGVGQGSQIAFDPVPSTTIATVSSPNATAVDAAGNLFLVNNNNLIEIPAANRGTQNVLYSGLTVGTAVAVDGAGNVLVADAGTSQVLQITPGGPVSTIATGVCPWGLAVDGAGHIFIPDACHNQVLEVMKDAGTQVSVAAGLNNPLGVAVDASGNLFIADNGNSRVLEVPAGGGTPITVLSSFRSQGLAVDAAGDLFTLDNGTLSEIRNGSNSPITLIEMNYGNSFALDGAGDLFMTAALADQVVEFPRSQPPAVNFPPTPLNQNSSPLSMTFENIGNQPLTGLEGGVNLPPNFGQLLGSGTLPDCWSNFSVAPGMGCNLSLLFRPTQTGVVHGTVEVKDNSLNQNPATQMFAVSGTGQ